MSLSRRAEGVRDSEHERDKRICGSLLVRSNLGLLLRVGVCIVQEKLCLDSHEGSRERMSEARFETHSAAHGAVGQCAPADLVKCLEQRLRVLAGDQDVVHGRIVGGT